MSLTEKQSLARSRASSLAHVRKLNCWGSDLTDISVVRQMVNLEVLNLSVNHISTLKDLSFCPKLKELYLRKNHIQDIDEIKYLKNLSCLKVIWLEDNPCTTLDNYRETLLRNLPSLAKIDNIHVVESEVTAAENVGNLVDNDISLPTFTGLDLNHTLSPDDIFKQIELLNIDQGQTTETHAVGDTFALQSQITKPDEDDDIETTVQASNSLDPPNNNLQPTELDKSKSNCLNAVLLLLNDLDSDELQCVSDQISTLISSSTEAEVSDIKPEMLIE